MLIRARLALPAAVMAALGLLAGSPAALAAPGGPATAAAGAAIPGNAGPQLGIDIQQAAAISNGRGVTIAVLASGVDPAVPGLGGKVTTGPDYTGGSHPGRMTGTIVAGLIAGTGTPGAPPSMAQGVAPAARILSVRTDEDGNEPLSDSFYNTADFNSIDARAIRYATDHGANVIFIDSTSTATPSRALESAVSHALARSVVIVAVDDDESSGQGAFDLDYPASLPGVIGVGAVDLTGPGEGQPFNNTRSVRNDSVLIAAPGNTVNSPGPGGQNGEVDGPEAAAALVAGTVALIRAIYPRLSPVLVARALALSARDHPPGGYDTTSGFGLVDPHGALTEAAQLAKAHGASGPAAVPGGTSPAGVRASALFRSGSPLPAIEVVHRSAVTLAGSAAAIVVGLACLAAAFWLRRRRGGPAGHPSEKLAQP